jgi:type II secretory pathway pseudopilin PulG
MTPQSQHGFGLVEIGIAIVIVIVASVLLGELLVQSTSTAAQSVARSEALALGERKLETLRTFASEEGYIDIAAPASAEAVTGTNAEFSIDWAVTVTDEYPLHYKTIAVTVSWDDPEGAQSVTLTSVLSRQIPHEAGKRLAVLAAWAAALP